MHQRVIATAAMFSLWFVCPSAALAEPQGNAGLTIGGAASGTQTPTDHAEFHLGLRGDVLFGRDDTHDFGVGPYLEVGTFAFDQVQFGGGASVLLPVHESFPLVASVGAYGRYGDDPFGVEPAVCGTLFWGTRSYNFHSNYVLAAGILVGYRHSLGDSEESMLTIAAQLDLAVLSLPVVGLINLIRGPSQNAAPVR